MPPRKRPKGLTDEELESIGITRKDADNLEKSRARLDELMAEQQAAIAVIMKKVHGPKSSKRQQAEPYSMTPEKKLKAAVEAERQRKEAEAKKKAAQTKPKGAAGKREKAATSVLQIVDKADNFPYRNDHHPEAYDKYVATLWKFCMHDDSKTVGYMPEYLVKRMPWSNDFDIDIEKKTVCLVPKGSGAPSKMKNIQPDAQVAMKSMLDGALEDLYMRDVMGYKENLAESCLVIGSATIMCIDRAVAQWFGIIAMGSHMTVFTHVGELRELKIWVPRRAWNKRSQPGLLDNTVARSITIGTSPWATVIKGARELCGLDPYFVKRNLVHCGTVSYMHAAGTKGTSKKMCGGEIMPRVRHLFDLEVDEKQTMVAAEHELADLTLCSVPEVRDAMFNWEFTYDAAMVLIDFFIRHGLLTSNEEQHYQEIYSRIHRHLPFPTVNPFVTNLMERDPKLQTPYETDDEIDF